MQDRIETRAQRKLREAREVLAARESDRAEAVADVERIEGSLKTATPWRKDRAAKLKVFGDPPEADPHGPDAKRASARLAEATKPRKELTAAELATAEAAWAAWLTHARRAVHARLSAAAGSAEASVRTEREALAEAREALATAEKRVAVAREDVEYAQARPGAEAA